jgi:exonuclease III
MDSVSILIWNVHGLNDKDRRDVLRKVVEAARPSVICLQETKLSHIFERDVSCFLGPEYTQFVYLPAQQTREGILMAWRDGLFSVNHHHVHHHCVNLAQQQ